MLKQTWVALLAQDIGCSSGQKGFLRCNISPVKGCAKRPRCTLIRKCDITSLSNLYKDCVEGTERSFVYYKTRRDKRGNGVCLFSVEKA